MLDLPLRINLLILAKAQLFIVIPLRDPEERNAPLPLLKDAFKSEYVNNFDFFAFAFNVLTTEAESGFFLKVLKSPLTQEHEMEYEYLQLSKLTYRS